MRRGGAGDGELRGDFRPLLGSGGSFRFREAFAFLGGGQKRRLPWKDRGRLRGPLEGGGLANPSRGGAEGGERKKKESRRGLGSLGPGRRGARLGRRGTSGVPGDDRALPGGPRRLRAREGSQGVSPRRGTEGNRGGRGVSREDGILGKGRRLRIEKDFAQLQTLGEGARGGRRGPRSGGGVRGVRRQDGP